MTTNSLFDPPSDAPAGASAAGSDPEVASYADQLAQMDAPSDDGFDGAGEDGWFAAPEDYSAVAHPDDVLPTSSPVDLASHDVPARLLAGLNPQQAEAVRSLVGPLMVVAGPGSGKTRVLTHRVCALLDAGVPAWRVLAVTFTNKAAKEMRERLEQMVGVDAARQLWVATFHSVCVRILRANAEAAGLSRDFTIADADDAVKLLGAGLDRAGQGGLERKELRALHSEISGEKNKGSTIAGLRTKGGGDRALADAWEIYEAELARVGALDFDDLLLRCLRLLETDEAVRARYQEKFSHVLVDEYQDTNPVQYRIVQILAAQSRNLAIVGDADQSIYAWRAADPKFMHSFTNDWPDAKVVVLDKNYRSTANILDVVRAIIAPNESEHRPALTTDAAPGAPVVAYVARDDRDEAAWVCDKIQQTPGSRGDHAILVRTHAQTRVIEEALKHRGLPYELVGATKFYDRAEIKDALAYLRFAVNSRDAIAFARAVTTPKRGVGPKAILDIDADAQDGDLYAAARRAADGTTKKAASIGGFLALVDQVRHAAETSGPSSALSVAIRTGGLKALHAKDDAGETRVENLQELVNGAATYVEDGDSVTVDGTPVAQLDPLAQTVAFLENVALVAAGDDVDDGAGRVQVVTSHASKGKEWPHVHVVGVEEGFYPHVRSKLPSQIEEERRLLFVACSRAETTLTISRAKQRVLFGGSPDARVASPFLSVLPATVERVESDLPDRTSSDRFSPSGNRDRFRPGTRRSSGYATSRRPSPPTTQAPAPAEPEMGAPLKAGEVYVGMICKHADLGMVTVERVAYGLATVKSRRLNKVAQVPFEQLTAL